MFIFSNHFAYYSTNWNKAQTAPLSPLWLLSIRANEQNFFSPDNRCSFKIDLAADTSDPWLWASHLSLLGCRIWHSTIDHFGAKTAKITLHIALFNSTQIDRKGQPKHRYYYHWLGVWTHLLTGRSCQPTPKTSTLIIKTRRTVMAGVFCSSHLSVRFASHRMCVQWPSLWILLCLRRK